MSNDSMTFFVSPDGNDSWSGLLKTPAADGRDGPLASLQGARDAIRKAKHAGNIHGPIEVLIGDGIYSLSEPVRLFASDSGTPDAPVIYRACPEAQPTISGGRRITNWAKYQDDIFVADIPDVRRGLWDFKQLFCNGKRMIRSRYPKYDGNDPLYGGWAFIESLIDDSDELKDVGILQLDGDWLFCKDANEVGEKEQWFSPDTDTSGWSAINTQASWQQQGHENYVGTAWYSTVVTLPEEFDARKHLWLTFGAVDKDATIYLDGEKIFEHTRDSTGMRSDTIWNCPFKFDIRPHLKPGRESRLTVKVVCNGEHGGIWRPVSLVSTNHDVSLHKIRGDILKPYAFSYQGDQFPRSWRKPHQSEIFVIPGKCWISDRIPIRRVDHEKKTIVLTRPVGPSRNTLGSSTHLVAGNRFYVENNLEDLSEPGEWCLDNEEGKVYFRPPPGVDIDDAQITAPCIETLIEICGSLGDAGQRLGHIHIEGLRFTQNQIGWPTPTSYYKTPNASAAVFMKNTEHCTITNNEFDAVGGDAIRLHGDNRYAQIKHNHIHDIGAYGIFIANYQKGYCLHDQASGDLPSPTEWHTFPQLNPSAISAWPRTVGHMISDNHIHHVGVYEKHGQGIAFYGVSASDVTVAHNHIHHTPRFGIGLMSGFGRIIIEHNDLHDLSLETCDTGGICFNRWYTSEEDPQLRDGPIIRYNRVCNVVGCGAYGIKAEPGGTDLAEGRIWKNYYSWGIYFDNAPMNVQVIGNICRGNTLGGLMISHYAQNVVVENNIFADSSKSQIYLLMGGVANGLTVRRNIITYRDLTAHYVRLNLTTSIQLEQVFDEFDYNLICTPPGKDITFSGVAGEALQRLTVGPDTNIAELSKSWWNSLGFDVHSVSGDPGFIDAGSGDYRLHPDSPALSLGFKPIDTATLGPR